MMRLGLLIPSSNSVMEPLAARQANMQVHVNRLGVVDISLAPESQAQFAMDEQVAAAKILCDVAVERIVWGGTSASWLGFGHDHAFVDRVTDETGIPTTTAVLQINHQLADLGVQRIGIVTPYATDVAQQINRNYEAEGFHVGNWRNHGSQLSRDFAAISPSVIRNMICEAAVPGVEAIVVMCTNLAAADLAVELTETLGIPVIDSALASFRYA